MCRRVLTGNDDLGLLDDPDEPVMPGSDDEDVLCDEGI